MKKVILIILSAVLTGCDEPTSDDIQRNQQERILQEGTASVGMPAITHFREKRLLKDILELRDQDGLTTYTYIVAEQTGELIFLGESIGYGIPAATQYTNPQQVVQRYQSSCTTIPQADPNGLFSPSAAEGTWVMMKDPNGDKVSPIYVEPRIIVSTFKLK